MKNSQKNRANSGRYLADLTREVSSQGRKANTAIAPNNAITPSNLFGIERRIA